MTTEQLNRARTLRDERISKERKLSALKDALAAIVPVRNGMPPAQKLTPKIEALTLKILELETEIKMLTAQEHEASLDILNAIISADALTDKEADILTYRYVIGMRFRDIQLRFNMSDATVFRIHADGIKKIIGDDSRIRA